MTRALLDVRSLGPGDWHVLRKIRLRALAESPHAFTSYYLRERWWTRRRWCRRLDSAEWIVALDRGEVIGIAAVVDCSPEEPHHVESIWVEPAHRGRGVLRSLVHYASRLTRECGHSELWLWVLEDNIHARRAYKRLGFVWTRERQQIGPVYRRRFERRLRLAI
jgi:ribosomal protein S18 acetylase RimI-like enzyme